MTRMATNTIGHAIAKDDGQICKNNSMLLVRKLITMADTIVDVKNDMMSAKKYTRKRNGIFLAIYFYLPR